HCYMASTTSFFFFIDPPTPEIYTLSLHDALPISRFSPASTPTSPAIPPLMPSKASPCRPCATSFPPCPLRPTMIRSWATPVSPRSEEHTSELQSRGHLVCRLLLEKKKKNTSKTID